MNRCLPHQGLRFSAVLVVTALVLATVACSKFRSQSSQSELKWHLVIEVEPSGSSSLEAAVTQTVAIIERRLDLIGIRGVKVRVQEPASNGRIEINLPALPDPERIKKLIISSGDLEIAHVRSPPNPAPVTTYETKEAATLEVGTPPGNLRVLRYVTGVDSEKDARWAIVETPAIVSGNDLRNATAIPSAGGSTEYSVSFSLRPDGAKRLSSWTREHINEYLAVILNDEIESIAFVKSEMYDTGEISGRFTKQSAEDLAKVLTSGAFPAKVRFIEERVD